MIQVLDRQGVAHQFERCASRADRIRIAVPFLTQAGINSLLPYIQARPQAVEVRLLTRFDTESMLTGVCEPEAIKALFDAAAADANLRVAVRRRESLHAKAFVFDSRAAIVGSTNLTAAGLSVNEEMGVYCTDGRVVAEVIDLFEQVWGGARDVDRAWVQGQMAFLAPRRREYARLKRQIGGLLMLPSLKMPHHENDFVGSLRAIAQRVRRGDATRQWLEEQLRVAIAVPDPDGSRERQLNLDKRLAFLQLLSLAQVDSDRLLLDEFGAEWLAGDADTELLCQRMAAVFPILGDAYAQITAIGGSGGGWVRFRQLAERLDRAEVTQELRDAVHWLRDLGLVKEEREGSEIAFHLARKSQRTKRLAGMLMRVPSDKDVQPALATEARGDDTAE